ncbi:hypothetical protein [uncultured Sphaerochaeta sp.]|uniref:hypothetical protein n=1 Tax=uncultured Sphaerochaeta sp. TaxID=886478 RepID=UPI002A0AA050|nr:hypothetical protein [uncultured Sphaerochaeta sp.]
MDIRRLRLWESRNATVLNNDLVRVVLEDQGGMELEFSSLTPSGVRINANFLPDFRGTGTSVYSDENREFWKSSPHLYHKAGSYFCFPNFGPAPTQELASLQGYGGFTPSAYWMVERYGTDPEFGGIWLMSTVRNRKEKWQVRKVDMLLPNQPVHYTACVITNTNDTDLVVTAAWNNEIGSPFLEAGCVLNSCAQSWVTAPKGELYGSVSRLAPDTQFDDWKKAPLQGGGTNDLTEVPYPIGKTDYILGLVPRSSNLGWTSVINPRQQMIYFTFFPGPNALGPDDIPVNFNNFLFEYGGRTETPWSLYAGGMSQQYSLNCGSGTNRFYGGYKALNPLDTLLGANTTVTIKAGETKTLYYAKAFCPYDNARIGGNFYSVEQVVEGLVLKRTKSWAFIPADSIFHSLKQLTKRLLTSE